MNLNTLKANIKYLDPEVNPATSDIEREYFRYYNINFEEQQPDVIHHFGHFPGGRFDIVAHYFEKKQASATCFIVHGYYDHTGLYGHLINYCLQNNFSVVIFDLPGHGLSTGERASITSFADYQVVFNDVLSFFSDSAPRPWHAIGQSTGAAILMDFLLSGNASAFSKTVLMAPLIRPEKWLISSISHSIAKVVLRRVRRHFSTNSHDSMFLDFLKNKDPLQSKYLPLQWVSALKQWIKYFQKLPSTNYVPLVIQGKQDGTVDWQLNLPIVKNKFPDAKVMYLKDGRHQLVNESADIRQSMFSAMDIYFDAFTH